MKMKNRRDRKGGKGYLILFTVQIKIAALHRLGNPDMDLESNKKISSFFSSLPLIFFKKTSFLVSDFALAWISISEVIISGNGREVTRK